MELSSDRATATLFYLENLPASARVQLTLNGNELQDSDGNLVDANLDGVPGGVGHVSFVTLSITPVLGTAIIGRVYASHLVPAPNNATNSVNLPLQGVTITVDGAEETVRTTTDTNGFFRLQPCPSGRFFVHVDGRTAVGSQWPNGSYYPVVGKAWEALHGETNNLAAGTGEIFLPLIKAGTLQPVSAMQDTTITFEPSVIASNPALASVHITVPANSLYSDNGARGGKVGIAPVPPDRLPEPLGPGLNFPLVITIQTDGPSNFDRPVPARFPNLPDPGTGVVLPPGAKTMLWSFNHDTGRWEPQGPMTITADGLYAESDPGEGVRQPGWHGTQPGGKVEIKPTCEFDASFLAVTGLKFAKTVTDCAGEFTKIGNALSAGATVLAAITKLTFLLKSISENTNGLTCEQVSQAIELLVAAKDTVKLAYDSFKEQDPVSKIQAGISCALNLIQLIGEIGCSRPEECNGELLDAYCRNVVPFLNEGTSLFNRFKELEDGIKNLPLIAICGGLDALVNRLSIDTLPFCGPLPAAVGPPGLLQQGPPVIFPSPQTLALLDTLKTMASDASNVVHAAMQQLEPSLPLVCDAQRAMLDKSRVSAVVIGTGGYVRHPYLMQIRYADGATLTERSVYHMPAKFWTVGRPVAGVVRGASGVNSWYDAEFNVVARCQWSAGVGDDNPVTLMGAPDKACELLVNRLSRFGGSCLPVRPPPPRWTKFDFDFQDGANKPDADGDGLSDEAEEIVGTRPDRADTDGDGISDLAELKLGLDPTGGQRGNSAGIVAAVDTAGTALDVCALNNVAVVADGLGGVVGVLGGAHEVYLYDVSSPSNTAGFLTLLPTPGLARAVSIFNGLAYVADGEVGLQVMNYLAYDAQGVPPTITLSNSFPMTSPTNGIAEAGQFITVTAAVTDDVQVRNVEFYLDGQLVVTDGNFPFEQALLTPLLTTNKTNFTLRAKATDTGGNFTFTPEIVVQLVPD